MPTKPTNQTKPTRSPRGPVVVDDRTTKPSKADDITPNPAEAATKLALDIAMNTNLSGMNAGVFLP